MVRIRNFVCIPHFLYSVPKVVYVKLCAFEWDHLTFVERLDRIILEVPSKDSMSLF